MAAVATRKPRWVAERRLVRLVCHSGGPPRCVPRLLLALSLTFLDLFGPVFALHFVNNVLSYSFPVLHIVEKWEAYASLTWKC